MSPRSTVDNRILSVGSGMLMAMNSGHDLYLCLLHEPYTAPDAPAPMNATIVHAATLLHADLPQPDAGRIYRCVTEMPRSFGEVVPLSTIAYELGGGALWSEVGDWEAVTDAVVALTRREVCDAMRLSLSPDLAALLSGGPDTVHYFYGDDGSVEEVGPSARAGLIADLTSSVSDAVANGGWWPGDGLIEAPTIPERMPYAPLQGSA